MRSFFVAVLLLFGSLTAQAQSRHTLLPVPYEMTWGEGHLALDSTFAVHLRGFAGGRIDGAVTRFKDRLSRATGMPLWTVPAADPHLVVRVMTPSPLIPQPYEDESYTLTITPDSAYLVAETAFGALRGMETFLQLAEPTPTGARVPVVRIHDVPRFPWRGLLLDVSRHWMPLPEVFRTLDAMAATKMNVLHLHASEDQGFRVESLVFPQLHELGSDGRYFTQDEIRALVQYAAERGIRVVPEFDVPGHASSWLVAFPELASAPNTNRIVRTWGIYEGILDPTQEGTYTMLDALFTEMAGLFPDPYFHIGGDEVPSRPWRESERIQAFMRDNNLPDVYALQAYFNRRLLDILQPLGKRMMGWDEILHPDVPTTAVIQSWRGKRFLARAAQAGYRTLLSNGYYIDLFQSAAFHYRNDPLEGLDSLSAEAQSRIVGGEATMWTEFVTPELLDARVWPRTAAIAERLWSPASVRDEADLYRRLDAHSNRLELADGLRIRAARLAHLDRITRGEHHPALHVLAGLVEPTEIYTRHGQFQRARGYRYSQHTPLHRLVDVVDSDAAGARAFATLWQAWQTAPTDELREELVFTFTSWLRAARHLDTLVPDFPLLHEVAPHVHALRQTATMGLRLLDAPLTPEDRAALEAMRGPVAELEFIPALLLLGPQ